MADNIDIKIPNAGEVVKRLVELAQERNINYVPSHESAVSLNDYCALKMIPVSDETINLLEPPCEERRRSSSTCVAFCSDPPVQPQLSSPTAAPCICAPASCSKLHALAANRDLCATQRDCQLRLPALGPIHAATSSQQFARAHWWCSTSTRTCSDTTPRFQPLRPSCKPRAPRIAT